MSDHRVVVSAHIANGDKTMNNHQETNRKNTSSTVIASSNGSARYRDDDRPPHGVEIESSSFFKATNQETEYAERRGLLPGGGPNRRSSSSLRRKQFDIRLRHLLQDTEQDASTAPDWRRAYWLGLALFLALLVFWILDSLKDPVFGAITGDLERLQPIAKLISVAFTIATVILTEYVTSNDNTTAVTAAVSTTRSSPFVSSNNDDDDNDNCKMADQFVDDAVPWQTIRTETSHEAAAQRGPSSSSLSSPHDDQARISVAIFSTIGIPYCIFFGLVAYCLQFNPNTRLMMVNDPTAAAASAQQPQQQQQAIPLDHDSSTQLLWRYLAYAWFAAIESYGSIVVATFWWYVNSTVSLHDAEAFYGIIIGVAQVGALAGSTMITMHIWTSVTLTISACLIIILHIVVMQLYDRYFPPTQPPQPQVQPHPPQEDVILEDQDDGGGDDDDDAAKQLRHHHHHQQQQEPHNVWSGLHLILQHNYVLLILGVSCLDEISLTCLNYQMTMIGWAKFDAADFGTFIGRYGQMVNLVSIVLSSLVFPRLIRRTGLKWTIRIFPTFLLLISTIAFWIFPGNLSVLFMSMALLKAMTYSIHDPAKELLYIPTSNAIKFKAKFWIDIVGARLAKALGSSINHIAGGNVQQSIRYASLPSILSALALWYACAKVGTEFETLVDEGTIVGVDAEERRQPPRYRYSEYSDDDELDDFPVGESPQAMELTAI
jgi:ATP/ADP translocase